jgi:hypothetical protein
MSFPWTEGHVIHRIARWLACCWVITIAAEARADLPPARRGKDRAIVVINVAPSHAVALGEEIEDVLITAARPGLTQHGMRIMGSTTMAMTRGLVQVQKDNAAVTRG